MSTILKYILFWFGLVILAILNGTIREKVYAPYISELSAHQLSTLIAIFLFSFYIWFIMDISRITSQKQAILIGFIWLIMTILFEFGFGYFIMNHTLSKLLYDYNLLDGRIWILVLLWTSFAPYTFYKLKN